MVKPKSTEEMGKQYHAHCPNCDSKFFTATEVVDLNYKCTKCHRRYLINLKDGSISILLTYIPKTKDKE